MVCYEAQTKCPRNDQSQTCCNTQFLSVLAETLRTDSHSFPAGSRGSGGGFQTTLVWAAAVRSGDAAVGIPRFELRCRHGWSAAPRLQTIRHGSGERREQMNLSASRKSLPLPSLASDGALRCFHPRHTDLPSI